jgi:large subunit ribosomal protein L6
MARIAKNPLEIPSGVKVKLEGDLVKVEGPKGKEEYRLSKGLHLDIQEKALVLNADDYKTNVKLSSLHGLTRTLLKNMLLGVSKGFEKKLEIRGVGYRAAVEKNKLNMTVGFSHPVVIDLPVGITIDVDKQVNLTVKGVNKYMVGETAARIRRVKPPEVYKGTGIRYVNEYVIQKVGKSAATSK